MIGPNGCAAKVERAVTEVLFPRWNREDSMSTQTVTHALSRLDLDRRGADPHPRQPAPMLLQKADTMFSSAPLPDPAGTAAI